MAASTRGIGNVEKPSDVAHCGSGGIDFDRSNK
jgi:hypothetical protein